MSPTESNPVPCNNKTPPKINIRSFLGIVFPLFRFSLIPQRQWSRGAPNYDYQPVSSLQKPFTHL